MSEHNRGGISAAAWAFMACFVAADCALAAPKISVTHKIETRKQVKTWGCWATATVILWNWKNAIPTTEQKLASSVSAAYRTLYDADQRGVTADEESAFYKALNLKMTKRLNPTIDGWASFLANGPLSVTVQNDPESYHALVVYGLTGDGTAAKTDVLYFDPFDGTTNVASFAEFVKKYESGVDYPLQISHW